MIDAYTETWREVVARCNDTIEQARTRLETNEQTYGESQFLRGRVAAMREILALAKPTVATASKYVDLRPKDRSGI